MDGRGGEGWREVSGESGEDTCGFKVIRISAEAWFYFSPRHILESDNRVVTMARSIVLIIS